jgi:hypothetical protein
MNSKSKVLLGRVVKLLDKIAATVAVMAFGVFVTGTPEEFVWAGVGLMTALATWGVATWIATEAGIEGR